MLKNKFFIEKKNEFWLKISRIVVWFVVDNDGWYFFEEMIVGW